MALGVSWIVYPESDFLMNDQLKNRLAISIMGLLKDRLSQVASSVLFRIKWREGKSNVFIFSCEDIKVNEHASIREAMDNAASDVRSWADELRTDRISTESTAVGFDKK